VRGPPFFFLVTDLLRSLVDHNIELLLRVLLVNVAGQSCSNLPENLPGRHNTNFLCARAEAEGSFSYASAFIKFIGAQYYHPPSMLDVILSLQRNDRKIISEADLFELLQRELCQNLNSRDAGTGEEGRRRRGQGEGWYLRVPSSAELEVSYTCSARITGL